MAEGKPRARPDAGAQLEELNESLARFLQHADQLLEDWARFGSQVRATVDQEAARIEQVVAEAGARATEKLAGKVDAIAQARVDKAVNDGLARVKAELERAGRATAVAAPPPAAADQRLLVGVAAANVLLVVLLAVTWMRGGSKAAPAAAVPVDAGAPAVSAAVLDACRLLAAGWDADAAIVVWRVGAEACGADAAAVAERMREHLAPPMIDAGPIDAGLPVDAKPKRGTAR